MFGDEALKLVREAKRAGETSASNVSPYNEEAVRNVLREMIQLFNDTKALLATDLDRTDVRLVLYHAAMQRNKRCLLAYHKQRVQAMQNMCWELGVLPLTSARENLSRSEVDFMRAYNSLLTKYKTRYVDVNLTATLLPPKELFVEVRVVQDCGKIQTEQGTVNLKRNSQHFLRRTDVEHLVRQGFLIHID